MTLLLAPLFVAAFLLATYAIALTLGQYRTRIKSVIASAGQAPKRVVRVGNIRYTGQRVRLVVVNPLAIEDEQSAFAFDRPRVA